jgi:hypothetical protein
LMMMRWCMHLGFSQDFLSFWHFLLPFFFPSCWCLSVESSGFQEGLFAWLSFFFLLLFFFFLQNLL